MSDEKHDNLLNADGSPKTEQQPETTEQTEQQQDVASSDSENVAESTKEMSTVEESTPSLTAEAMISEAEADEVAPEEVSAEQVLDEANIISLTDEQVADDTLVVETPINDNAIDAISNQNAEDSEHGHTSHDQHEIKDYEAMSMEDLVDELEQLSQVEKVMSVKEHIEHIKTAFLAKYHHFIEQKRGEFTAQNEENVADFHYNFPLKHRFDTVYNQYRDKKNTHFKSLQSDLKSNLETRLAIVEELKNLINPQENIKDTLKHFNELRDRWKNAGSIPKDKYNHVWNNYHFHVENFYDYLHLDREARDIDFKHNLEQKQKIIARTEELVNEQDINKAFRELQDLHRIWKEDIGPVSREHREDIWNRFSELTREMHDKREVLFADLRKGEDENLVIKHEIISQIEELTKEKITAHSQWQGQIEKIEALRSAFFAAGKVPNEVNEQTWTSFKNAVRDFNSTKNAFYKDIKKDQQDNLNKKMALVEKAKQFQDSEDFATTTPLMKQIQDEWKQIGHVPRKYSDKIWKEFKEACNHYFEKLKAQKSEANSEETDAFDKKKAYLDTIRSFEMTGDHKTDLDAIKMHIETWKGFGRVPFAKRHIEGKFNKILDALFEKLSLSKKDSDMMRFSNRIDSLAGSEDMRKIESEKIFLMRKVDEVQNEIFQLENNIQFFANTKNAKKENSIVLEVRKNIEKHKEELVTLKQKLKQLRNMKTE